MMGDDNIDMGDSIQREEAIDAFVNNTELDSKEKIVKLLEIEYDFLEKQQSAMFYSNEEMLKFDPSDIDIIEARSENVKIMCKNMERMMKIKNDLLGLDREHYIAGKDLYEFRNCKIEKYEEKVGSVERIIIKDMDDESKGDEEIIKQLYI
jgi:hypothetical protein